MSTELTIIFKVVFFGGCAILGWLLGYLETKRYVGWILVAIVLLLTIGVLYDR